MKDARNVFDSPLFDNEAIAWPACEVCLPSFYISS